MQLFVILERSMPLPLGPELAMSLRFPAHELGYLGSVFLFAAVIAGLAGAISQVLGFFARHAGATQRDLVEHSGRDKAQLARLIKGLREQGLLVAEPDPDDRRNQCLSLTAAGKDVQQTLKLQARRLSAKAVAGLDADERVQLSALLMRVRRNLAPE